jgi:hypothetical protein
LFSSGTTLLIFFLHLIKQLLPYKKKTIILILIASLVRCIIAGSIQLGNDEVYYRMYAQYLQWNYFDHPPMVAWLIRISTANLFFDTEFFIRFGAIASAAITSWLLYLSGKKLYNDHAGFLAAAIYTATIYGSIIAGTFILPDAPQMVCWTSGLYLLIHITSADEINAIKKTKLLLFGVVCGIGMLCKIHTVFLWVGFLLYVVLYKREWLKQPVLYYSGIITILFFYPVIQWNIDNHFITYRFHSNRVNVAGSGLDLNSFARFFAGQVFYYNPVIFIFIIIATIAAIKKKLPVLNSQKRILLCCNLPLILIATTISLFKNVLPHWTGPAYSGLILFAAVYFVQRKEKKMLPAPVLVANLLLAAIVIAGIITIHFLPGTLGKKEKTIFGEDDFTLDMYGWREIKKSFEDIVTTDINTGRMKTNAAIVSNKWFPAAHTDFYIARPLQKSLIAISDTNDIHQYAWINKQRKKLQPGDDAYCIIPSNYNADVKTIYSPYFAEIIAPEIIEQKRNGSLCRNFYIWRLKHFIAK